MRTWWTLPERGKGSVLVVVLTLAVVAVGAVGGCLGGAELLAGGGVAGGGVVGGGGAAGGGALTGAWAVGGTGCCGSVAVPAIVRLRLFAS